MASPAFRGQLFVKFGGNKMAKRKKRIATVNRKLGISISCRVHKSVLKDLDAYRESLKLSRSAALVKLATDHLARLKEPASTLTLPDYVCKLVRCPNLILG